MKKKDTTKLHELLHSLSQVGEEEKLAILKELKSVQKEVDKSQFRYRRTTMDKQIIEKALNATIENLEKNQEEIQFINKQLSAQKEELKRQKQIIEEKSFTLEENLKKLELSYMEMEQFAYIASHDLKSPLRTISNFAQLVKRRNYDLLDEESKEFVDFIVSGAKQMHEVICDSLEYARVGHDIDSFRTTDFEFVVEAVRFNLKKEMEENNAQVIIDGQLPSIRAHKTSVIQLFQNLISNAVKFRGKEDPVIRISCSPIENGYQFSVADNGTGMDENFQHKAFQPFQRLNDRHKPGSGIGLAICKKIVEKHGGKISFNSVKGQGTIFNFTLFNLKAPISREQLAVGSRK